MPNKGDHISLEFRMDPKNANTKERTIEAAISNATEVDDALLGRLSLVHSEDAIDMTRAKNGLVMLFNHDRNNPIGRIENVRLDPDKTLRGTFRFSQHESADRYWSQVDDGTLTDISVGADVIDFEEGDDGVVSITRWRPYEASIVSIGRIPTAKIGMSHTEETSMADEIKTGDEQQPETKTAGQVLAAKARANAQEQGKGIEFERKRVKAIRELFDKPAYVGDEYKTLLNFCIDEGLSLEQTQTELLDFIGFAHEGVAPSAVPFSPQREEPKVAFSRQQGQRRAEVSMGKTHDEKIHTAMTDAVNARILAQMGEKSGIDNDNPYRGMSFGDLARHFAREVGMAGVDYAQTDRIVATLMSRDAPRLNLGPIDLRFQHATGDFPGIFANMIDKAIAVRYEKANETWRMVSRVGQLADFKQASRPSLSSYSNLKKIPEGGEYKHGTRSDAEEFIQAGKYGSIFSLTREALINDDLQAFADQSMAMADAANANVGDLVWDVFLSNPVLNQDGIAVFDPLHNNIAAVAGPPSVGTLSEARRLMRLQKDISDTRTLNLSPALLIVPPGWETEALTLISAQNLDYDINTGNEIVQKNAGNQFGTLTPVVENRLGGVTGTDTAWYMQAPANGSIPFIETSFVRGQETPEVMTQEGWSVDGIEYKVRQEFGVAPLAYQPVVRNAGA